MIAQKPLPNDERIERTVLYYLMNNESIHYSECMNLLTDKCFYNQMYAKMYRVTRKLIDTNTSFTMTDVFAKTEADSDFVMQKIYEVFNDADIANDDTFSRRVVYLQELSMSRQVIQKLTPIVNNQYRKNAEPFQDLETIMTECQDIFPESSEDIGRADDYISKALLASKDLKDNPNNKMGITYGIRKLDQNLRGLNKGGELVIIGGATNIGKSMLGVHMAVSAQQKGYKAMYASVEMGRQDLFYRMSANHSGIPTDSIKFGDFTDEQYNNLVSNTKPSLQENGIVILDKNFLSLESIVRSARKEHRTNGLDVLYVDYLQALTVDNPQYKSYTERAGYSAIVLKELASELKIPVVALVQLGRDYSKGGAKDSAERPRMYDIQHSSSIEQTANKIILMHRPSYHTGDTNDTLCELIVAKNREGGRGIYEVDFLGATCQFKARPTNSREIINPNADVEKVTTQSFLTV